MSFEISKNLVNRWFEIWTEGNFKDLPISENFKHFSPYGVVEGKEAYLNLVESAKADFLGNTFEVIDTIYSENKVSVRYKMTKGNVIMDISEWYYFQGDLISEIHSFYDRKD